MHPLNAEYKKKMIDMKLLAKQKQTHGHKKNVRGWRMREEVHREFGIDVYTLLFRARTYSIAQGILLNVMWRLDGRRF